MIKENESDVLNIDYELQAKIGDKFFMFHVILTPKKCPYLCNQIFKSDGIKIKVKYLKWTSDLR